MSTTTVNALLATAISTSWDYISGTLGTLLPYGIGIAILFGAIYFVLRRTHVLH